MIYRDALPGDLPAIDALYRASFIATFGHLYSAENLAAFLSGVTIDVWADEFTTPGLAFRVVVDDDGLAGYAKLGPLKLPAETNARAVELRQLYLADRLKGSGAAQQLMDWTIATARAHGAEELWLSVYVDNHRAKRFYLRNGFEDMARYVFMVGDHPDEDRLMRRRL